MSEANNNGSKNNANSLQVPTNGVAMNKPANNNEMLPAPPSPPQPSIIQVPRLEAYNPKKAKTMAEFLASMDNYAPIVSILLYTNDASTKAFTISFCRYLTQ